MEIDIDYYKQQQIMPPITRIIMHIDGLSPETIAECLGLDGSRYRSFNNGYFSFPWNNSHVQIEIKNTSMIKFSMQMTQNSMVQHRALLIKWFWRSFARIANSNKIIREFGIVRGKIGESIAQFQQYNIFLNMCFNLIYEVWKTIQGRNYP